MTFREMLDNAVQAATAALPTVDIITKFTPIEWDDQLVAKANVVIDFIVRNKDKAADIVEDAAKTFEQLVAVKGGGFAASELPDSVEAVLPQLRELAFSAE